MIKAQQQLLQVTRVGRLSPTSLNPPWLLEALPPVHVTEPGRLLLLHLPKSIEVTFSISVEFRPSSWTTSLPHVVPALPLEAACGKAGSH